MNICNFLGRLTRDPELKTLANGTAVLNFGIAVSETFKKQDGTKGENVSFLDLEAWASGAETINTWFKKGDPILVRCKAKQESWEKDGQKHSRVKFRVEEFWFVPQKKADGGEAKSSPAALPAPKTDKPVELNDNGEQIPF